MTPPYTHGYAPAVLSGHRRRTAENSAAYLLPHLRPGLRLLDVGSGAGTITADLARIVGPENVTALEVEERSAQLTRDELAAQGISGVRVVVGDAHDLPFETAEFDVVHAHQVLQHVRAPIEALAQMRRVTQPGGIVAARDADYGAFRWWPEAPELDRWRELYEGAARANGGAPDAGRRLLAWAHAAGFADVGPSASTWCYATEQERAWWAGTSAERISGTALGAQLVREGRAAQEELDGIAVAFRAWAEDADGWFTLLHGEIIARA
ncbi:methyltransferase domain-containing protein [Brachybacterium sp. JHP9]|uniref:Methyltransferase domain-containing protein n=1 Tax=Brachybacterium equifaecis TaxID=2910770 RepID=A0ABT0R1C9_9MICO|nr:methyltransferase domain-containing protein [Brachybacterium equifaecis]MCL6423049.1 methyltransferase domain-containing protein [Brachybacterium equifaecis]